MAVSDTILTLLGFGMVTTFMVLIMTRRMSPLVALTLIPILFALVAGFGGPGLGAMMLDGIGTLAPTGVMLILAGSVVTQIAGAVIVLVLGDWMRRLLLVAVLVPPLAWWLTALAVLPFPRFSGPDPVTLAYSLPQAAAVALVLPAVAVTMIALVPLQPDRSVRLRPVHDARDVRPPGDE